MDTLNINSITSYASSLASNNTTQSLTSKAQNAQTDEELMEACQEFENYLWEQVIKSMKSTTNILGEDSSSSSSQTVDYFMDSAISNVSKQMTQQTAGPNSLAQQMYEQMKRTNTIDVETILAQSAAASGVSTEE